MTCYLKGDNAKDFIPDKTIEALDRAQEFVIDEMRADLEEHKCPICGGRLKEYHQANGPDDYDVMADCLDCGATFG